MASPNKAAMQSDLDSWVARASNVARDPSGITNPTGTAPWSSSFFECFSPIDTCAITCCCPCVTFGKTHHRLHKDANLNGYSPVNTSCLGWWAIACCGFHCIPNLLQRHDIRSHAQPNLSGNFVTDFLKSWCCSCCDLIQQDKEAAHLMANNGGVVIAGTMGAGAGMGMEPTTMASQQPMGKTEGMTYAAPPQ